MSIRNLIEKPVGQGQVCARNRTRPHVAMFGGEGDGDVPQVREGVGRKEVEDGIEVVVSEDESRGGVKSFNGDKTGVAVDQKERERKDAALACGGEGGVAVVAAAGDC